MGRSGDFRRVRHSQREALGEGARRQGCFGCGWGAAVPTTAPSASLRQRTSSGLSGLTVDRGAVGAFEAYAATQARLQHSGYGRVREGSDAIGSWCNENWAFLAVADGLGSSACAHIPSRLAAQSAIRTLCENFPGLGRVEIDQAEWHKYSPPRPQRRP